ncbi:unnamed protein product [Calicophoron daubneyi]|uniref:Copper transport protein n=1 Tax=Calicophoron daubneyi TaxID=300641 RepID=A0AAV2T8H1_CALDB
MMRMYFNVDLPFDFLFEPWKIKTNAEVVGAFFGAFVVAILYEGFLVLRENLLLKALSSQPQEEETEGSEFHNASNTRWPRLKSMFSGSHILQAFLHLIQVFVSYMLMLMVMAYNAYVILAVCLGLALGYFLFSVQRPVVTNRRDCCA